MSGGTDKRPFYREPMVWMLIGIPLASVLMGIVMITLAVNTNDGLVVDDYYKKGLQINRTLARDARAGELDLRARIRFSAGDNRVSVRLTGRPSFEAPGEIRLGFYHATRQGEDQVLSLRIDAEGVYSAPMPELTAGRWYISAETDQWRLTRVMEYPVNDILILTHRSRPGASEG
jgi:hypothetical protein